MNQGLVGAFLWLQAFVVVFILLHDWVPLGRLNNLEGVRAVDPLQKRALVTVLSAVPFALCLWFSWEYARSPHYPMWVKMWLWTTYGVGALGAVRAWWWPYLGPGDPVRRERYRVFFAGTHRFLPERNGVAPDTLHVVLHGVMAAILVLLATI